MKKDYISVVYDEKRTPKTDYPKRLAIYLSQRFSVQKNMKLLEIGCGRGEFLQAFQELGLGCFGVDLSDFYMKNQNSTKIKCLDIRKDRLPYGDATFDIVYHKSLLEHLYDPTHLMRETYRVLKPKGRIIILTPDWVSQTQVFYEDFTHCRPYDTTSLYDLLHTSGFSAVMTERFYQLPLIWKHSFLKIVSRFLELILSVPTARRLTQLTGIKFFRWSVELMVLGTGVKY